MSVLSVYDATRGYLYHNQGLRNDLDFWSLYSGITGHASWTTHADYALSKNGYTGSLNDKMIKWASDLTGHTDWSFEDNVLYFFKSLPSGLTFFKNYDSIPDQTSADATLLNANLSVGSGVATFTSTDSNLTINGGYQATTANDEVLKYLIAGNRTAAQETCVIKFIPSWGNTAGSVGHHLLDTNTKRRHLTISSRAGDTNEDLYFFPNDTDTSGSSFKVYAYNSILPSTPYCIIATCNKSSPYITYYLNGSLISNTGGTDADYTVPAWGTSFFVGCNTGGSEQFDGVVVSVAFFNRVLTASEAIVVNGLM